MYSSYLKYGTLIATIYILCSMIIAIHVYGAIQVVNIIINSDGIANVYANATLTEGLNRVLLPIEPVPETIVVKQNGRDIPPIYYNGTLIIPLETAGPVEIRYMANVSVYGGKILLKIGHVNVILKAMRGVVLLSVPENVFEARTENGVLILRFAGPAELSYTIAGPPTVPPETKMPFPAFPFPIWMALLPIFIIVIVVLLYRRRRLRGLGYLDKAILEALRDKGGKALQTELISELKVPKTTLWRHVRKLEALGYVEIEQIGRVNIIKLK